MKILGESSQSKYRHQEHWKLYFLSNPTLDSDTTLAESVPGYICHLYVFSDTEECENKLQSLYLPIKPVLQLNQS
ncbi:hypothetical protein J6590_065450 [Homalodisca vitripennis]|nr:hypothetical protein J6590_065450 [Homalodisca vitripennis]